MQRRFTQSVDNRHRPTTNGRDASNEIAAKIIARYVARNIAVWRSGRGESYVNRVGDNGARLSGRYHCGLDRRAWIWAHASD